MNPCHSPVPAVTSHERTSSHSIMNRQSSMFARWHNMLAFWCGSAMVASGVALHLPMFWMGRKMHFKLVGMPMTTGMYVGMALIILGVLAAAYGLLPPRRAASISQ